MPDPAPCKHDCAVAVEIADSFDKAYYCPDCDRCVPGYELPEGPLRDYWRDKREAWGGR